MEERSELCCGSVFGVGKKTYDLKLSNTRLRHAGHASLISVINFLSFQVTVNSRFGDTHSIHLHLAQKRLDQAILHSTP